MYPRGRYARSPSGGLRPPSILKSSLFWRRNLDKNEQTFFKHSPPNVLKPLSSNMFTFGSHNPQIQPQFVDPKVSQKARLRYVTLKTTHQILSMFSIFPTFVMKAKNTPHIPTAKLENAPLCWGSFLYPHIPTAKLENILRCWGSKKVVLVTFWYLLTVKRLKVCVSLVEKVDRRCGPCLEGISREYLALTGPKSGYPKIADRQTTTDDDRRQTDRLPLASGLYRINSASALASLALRAINSS